MCACVGTADAAELRTHIDQAQLRARHAEREQAEVLGDGVVLAVARALVQRFERAGPVVDLAPDLGVVAKGDAPVEELVHRLQLAGLVEFVRRGEHRLQRAHAGHGARPDALARRRACAPASQAHSGRWPSSSKRTAPSSPGRAGRGAAAARSRARRARAVHGMETMNGAKRRTSESDTAAPISAHRRLFVARAGDLSHFTVRSGAWSAPPGARLRGGAPAKRELLRAHAESIVPSHPVTGLTRLRIEADIAYSTRALHWA